MTGRTLVYTCDVDFLCDPGAFERALEQVSFGRREKIGRIRFLKDKRLSLGAELLLKAALARQGIESLPEIEYQKGGKPYFKDLPNLFFNLSHSGSRALCTLSDSPVGCDIEKISAPRMNVAKRCFCSEEYRHICSLPEGKEQAELFFRYWVLKESFVKAVGAGLGLAFNRFCINFEDEKITVRQNFDKNEYSFYQFEQIPDYKCAVCVLGKTDEIVFEDINLKDARAKKVGY